MEEVMEQLNPQLLNHLPNLLLMIVINLIGLVIIIVMMVTTMKDVAGMVETAAAMMSTLIFVLYVNVWIHLIQQQQQQLNLHQLNHVRLHIGRAITIVMMATIMKDVD